MRNLTLRIWDEETREMYYYPVTTKNKKQSFMIFSNIDEEKCEVMLAVGLHDLDGKDLYEGDIVQHGEYNNMIGDIYYSAPRFVVKTEDEVGTPNWIDVQDLRWKVIGDIFRNPELLNHE